MPTQRWQLGGLALAAGLWLVLLYVWLSSSHLPLLSSVQQRWLVQIVLGVPAILGLVIAWRMRTAVGMPRAIVQSLAFLFVWPAAVFTLDHLGWPEARANTALVGTTLAFVIGLGWAVWAVDRATRHFARRRAEHAARQAAGTAPQGEAATTPTSAAPTPAGRRRVWNPLDLDAWYYGRARKLNQSLSTFLAYSVMFLLMALLILNLQGCGEVFEKPFGGGEEAPMVQQVQIQKVKKKEYVINPFSSIIFTPPPIEKVELQLLELTKHYHTPGYGQGEGHGFATGTNTGKIQFIRLEYAGGNWNNRMSADTIMLTEYGIRLNATSRTAKAAESRTISQLGRADPQKSPAFVYLNGSRGIRLSKSEIETLRSYVLDRHGMIFADASSSQFHREFMAVMREVLPNAQPVPVPLDDKIHLIPFPVGFAAYVTPHGGKEALGWRIDGRWAVYYHPGDLGDAWMDDHSGVPPRVWEACYRIGANVMFYAYVEHTKWQQSQEQR